MDNSPYTPQPAPPPPMPRQPEPPRKNYFLRNMPGLIGFLCIVSSALFITVLSDTFLTNLWPVAFIAGLVLCTIGLFRSPRLLPALGCMASLALAVLMGVVLLAVGQWKAPERGPEEIDSTAVEEVVAEGDTIALTSPDTDTYVP